MKSERARERYVLRIQLLDAEDVSVPVLLATLPLMALRSGPMPYLKRTRAEMPSIPPPVLDLSEDGTEAPTISSQPLSGLDAMYVRLGPDERLVTITSRGSGGLVLQFLVPAGDKTNAVVVELQHDYMRQDADEWRDKWIVDLANSLGGPT